MLPLDADPRAAQLVAVKAVSVDLAAADSRLYAYIVRAQRIRR